MTVREISKVTGISTDIVKVVIRKLYPNKMARGKTTKLGHEESVVVINALNKQPIRNLQVEQVTCIQQHQPLTQQPIRNLQVDMIVTILKEQAEERKQQQEMFLKGIAEIVQAIKQSTVQVVPQIEMKQDYFSILAFCRKNNIKFTFSEAIVYGKNAVKKSAELGYEVRRIPDERFGTVGSYHINVLDKVFEL